VTIVLFFFLTYTVWLHLH